MKKLAGLLTILTISVAMPTPSQAQDSSCSFITSVTQISDVLGNIGSIGGMMGQVADAAGYLPLDTLTDLCDQMLVTDFRFPEFQILIRQQSNQC